MTAVHDSRTRDRVELTVWLAPLIRVIIAADRSGKFIVKYRTILMTHVCELAVM